ncbi:hypothetical protein D5086_012441 [Populus alba]|uniref:Uncharacterized protein n=1 Tax=Populus alba TaxID=43335 RepID=A0ACC4C256_POPAL
MAARAQSFEAATMELACFVVTALLPLVVFFMLKLYSSNISRKTMLGLLAAGGARTWERHGGEDVYY